MLLTPRHFAALDLVNLAITQISQNLKRSTVVVPHPLNIEESGGNRYCFNSTKTYFKAENKEGQRTGNKGARRPLAIAEDASARMSLGQPRRSARLAKISRPVPVPDLRHVFQVLSNVVVVFV